MSQQQIQNSSASASADDRAAAPVAASSAAMRNASACANVTAVDLGLPALMGRAEEFIQSLRLPNESKVQLLKYLPTDLLRQAPGGVADALAVWRLALVSPVVDTL